MANTDYCLYDEVYQDALADPTLLPPGEDLYADPVLDILDIPVTTEAGVLDFQPRNEQGEPVEPTYDEEIPF